MDALNTLLLKSAEFVLDAWDAVSTFLGWVWDIVDYLLNPILSPVLAFLNPVTTAMGDALYAVLSPMSPGFRLIVLSVAMGAAMLFGFRHLSNQTAITRVKDDIKANLLALKLFKDDLIVTARVQVRLLWAVCRFQRYVLIPVLWMALPMLLAIAQMGLRCQWRPLRVGESTVLKVGLDDPMSKLSAVTFDAPKGIEVEVGPLPGLSDLAWKVRADAPGRHVLTIHVDGSPVEKEVVVGEVGRVNPLRPGPRWTDQLLYPAETRLPALGQVRFISLEYPPRDSWFYGSDYWALWFFVISMAAALILAPVFKVKF